MVASVKYEHKVHLEDLWANIADEHEIKKRMFWRLSHNMIRTCKIIQVPDQVEEYMDVI